MCHIPWTSRVISWPYFLLSNELLSALSEVCRLADAPDTRLWHKICKNKYRRCAVIEAYDSVKHLLLEMIKDYTEEHSIVAALFDEIDHSLQIRKFSEMFDMTVLPKIHATLIHLVEWLNRSVEDPEDPDQVVSTFFYWASPKRQVVSTLQALYNIVILDFFKQKRSYQQLKENGLAPVLCLWAMVFGLAIGSAVGLDGEGRGLCDGSYNYTDALAKAILFFEGQRSGKLPADQRVEWRADSALTDGQIDNVMLVAYYASLDNPTLPSYWTSSCCIHFSSLSLVLHCNI